MRSLLAFISTAALLGLAATGASAQRPAKPSEFAAINHVLRETERTLRVRLASVSISTKGPFALAHYTGGQPGWLVLKGAGVHWRGLATISDEGLPCHLVPPAVVADLHLERYNEGPKPCSAN